MRRNDLHVPAMDDGEGRAQNFMAPDDFIEAALQHRRVDAAT